MGATNSAFDPNVHRITRNYSSAGNNLKGKQGSGDFSISQSVRRRGSSGGSDDWGHLLDIAGEELNAINGNNSGGVYHHKLISPKVQMNKSFNFGSRETSPSNSKEEINLFSKKAAVESNVPDEHQNLTDICYSPPDYILECDLQTQQLWYITAGKRPPQPKEVKVLIEQLWRSNLQNSQVPQCHYENYPKVTGGSSSNVGEIVEDNELLLQKYDDGSNRGGGFYQRYNSTLFSRIFSIFGSCTENNEDSFMCSWCKKYLCCCSAHNSHQYIVLAKKNSIYSSSVSKSFFIIPQTGDDKGILIKKEGIPRASTAKQLLTVTLQIPKFRVVRDVLQHVNDISEVGICTSSAFAEFLVVITYGDAQSFPVMLGIWRRHSDFKCLVDRLQSECISGSDSSQFSNSLISWQCVVQRQRYGKCLDMEYLSLKCHLLERFLHDVLFESGDHRLISDFLNLDLDW